MPSQSTTAAKHDDEDQDLEGFFQRANYFQGSVKLDSPHTWPSLNPRYVRRTVVALARRCLYAFVPQLIRTYYFHDPLVAPPAHSTSWMNSLRGLASLAVFNEHYFYFFTYRIITGYGASAADKYWHQLPVVFLFSDGVCGVVVFFTIAGYACSYKPLQANIISTVSQAA